MLTTKLPQQSADQLYRIQDVVALTTLSKSCINLWIAQKRFPKPVALSSTVKIWRASDIHVWIKDWFDRMEVENSTPNLTAQKGGSHEPLMPTVPRKREQK